MHIGFSTSTDLPASSPAVTCRQWNWGGEETTRASIRSSSSRFSNRSKIWPPPNSAENRSALSRSPFLLGFVGDIDYGARQVRVFPQPVGIDLLSIEQLQDIRVQVDSAQSGSHQGVADSAGTGARRWVDTCWLFVYPAPIGHLVLNHPVECPLAHRRIDVETVLFGQPKSEGNVLHLGGVTDLRTVPVSPRAAFLLSLPNVVEKHFDLVVISLGVQFH